MVYITIYTVLGIKNDSQETWELEPMVCIQEYRSLGEQKQHEEDYKGLSKLIKKLKDYDGSTLDSDYWLKINGAFAWDREFIEKSLSFELPPIQKLQITNLNEFKSEDDMYSINSFLSNTMASKINNLFLSGTGTEIKNYQMGIRNALKRVVKKAHFKWFQLDDDDIQNICKCLVIPPCYFKLL